MISLRSRLGSSSYKKEKMFRRGSKGKANDKRQEMKESSLGWRKGDSYSGTPKEG